MQPARSPSLYAQTVASTQQAASNIAEQVRAALDSGDLEAFSHLLDPNVRWGPGDHEDSGCTNRSQVIAWWGAGRESRTRAQVTELVAHGAKLLVGLSVTRSRNRESEQPTERWQVMTVRNGRVVDNRGFGDRESAAARAGV